MSIFDDLRGLLWDIQFADRKLNQEEAYQLVAKLMETQDALAQEKRKYRA